MSERIQPEPQSDDAAAAIVESSLDAVVIVNDAGEIVGANPATETLFGYSVSNLVGLSVSNLIPDIFPRVSDSNSGQDVKSGFLAFVGKNQEVEGRRENGENFQSQLAVSEVELDGQKLFTFVIRDLSELETRKGRLEAILDNAVDAIITIDELGIVDSVNRATEKVFGYAADEIQGRNIKILMPEPYQREHDGYLKNYRDSGIRKIIGIGREVIGQRKDGTKFPMHLAVSEVKIGNRRMFTGIVRDISDLKQAQQELAGLNEQLEERVKERTVELKAAQAELVRSEKFATLGKVSGGIAHEIRNPLNAVKTSAYYLLNAKNASEEKIQEHLERIDRQVSLIDNVVTALSDVAKLPEANLSPCDLLPVLKGVVGSIEIPSNIQAKSILPDELPQVQVDEGQIVIAFKNLIRNARDAMLDGGELVLSATIHETSVEFHVTDSGVGIPPENIGQVLEPLFTTKARGMGLGLSITRAIVEKNQGKLSVESELGKGSRFTIELNR